MNEEQLKQKRQRYHQLLIALGWERYKEVIVSSRFNVKSTIDLTEQQMDELIEDAKHHLYRQNRPVSADAKQLRTWRNRCLLVLAQRDIKATPKDWSAVNNELAKKQYQWIMSPAELEKGHINQKGLYAFTTVDDLKKLFNQLSAIRDNELIRAKREQEMAFKN
ncbi:MAG: hypothetical protein A2W90_18110 [Bacteroidetes bacterium GWF2_42_66]|nr:MAG: hypothetical protein A2W92_06100 [Bacteroidetes bacterium GWA2_42_15]OFX98167.1 MAG: hypothetical protein A2W89_09600 [Bacteroidetes bacterium GWE2_42_39]OFY42552.1 MAG: hypothetical protein A2W90_18110 [Bacteroidetes bacterium GWF2_42_66]HBL74268.1 hypothetical protein [Prolixibacteraceae bacterium]HCU64037.1 hypothetical protein [Prolixibacteraceae bacterium]